MNLKDHILGPNVISQFAAIRLANDVQSSSLRALTQPKKPAPPPVDLLYGNRPERLAVEHPPSGPGLDRVHAIEAAEWIDEDGRQRAAILDRRQHILRRSSGQRSVCKGGPHPFEFVRGETASAERSNRGRERRCEAAPRLKNGRMGLVHRRDKISDKVCASARRRDSLRGGIEILPLQFFSQCPRTQLGVLTKRRRDRLEFGVALQVDQPFLMHEHPYGAANPTVFLEQGEFASAGGPVGVLLTLGLEERVTEADLRRADGRQNSIAGGLRRLTHKFRHNRVRRPSRKQCLAIDITRGGAQRRGDWRPQLI